MDLNQEISRAYDVLLEGGISLRGLFLIDKEGVVRHRVVNDLPLGRSVDEALRNVQSLQFFEENGEVWPAKRLSEAVNGLGSPSCLTRDHELHKVRCAMEELVEVKRAALRNSFGGLPPLPCFAPHL